MWPHDIKVPKTVFHSTEITFQLVIFTLQVQAGEKFNTPLSLFFIYFDCLTD